LPIKWVEKDNLHLTLVFLGSIDHQKVKKVAEIAQQVAEEWPTFKLKIKKLGIFPRPQKPRLLWVGLEDNHHLFGLQKKLVQNLKKVGFLIEEREFIAHLTLGRLKKKVPLAELKKLTSQFGQVELGEFEVQAIEVTESILTSQGPLYKILKKVDLKV